MSLTGPIKPGMRLSLVFEVLITDTPEGVDVEIVYFDDEDAVWARDVLIPAAEKRDAHDWALRKLEELSDPGRADCERYHRLHERRR